MTNPNKMTLSCALVEYMPSLRSTLEQKRPKKEWVTLKQESRRHKYPMHNSTEKTPTYTCTRTLGACSELGEEWQLLSRLSGARMATDQASPRLGFLLFHRPALCLPLRASVQWGQRPTDDWLSNWNAVAMSADHRCRLTWCYWA